MRRAVFLTALATFSFAPAVAAARPPCGPADAKTLARSKVARVYVADGAVRGCHRAGRGSRRIAPRRAVLDAWVAGRYAAVRQRRRGGERLLVINLRRWREVERLVSGRFVRVRLDPAGVAGFTAARRTPAGWPREGVVDLVGAESDVEADLSGPHVGTDVLGMAGPTFAYRQGDSIALQDFGGGPDARTGLLVRLGDLRMEVTRDASTGYELVARPRGGRPISLARSVDGFQRAGGLLATSRRSSELGGNGSAYIDGINLAKGTQRRLVETAGAVGSFVAMPAGRVAYINALPYGGKTVRAGDAVLDSGDGINIFSLRRRGDRLEWRHSGTERSAPLPPGWR